MKFILNLTGRNNSTRMFDPDGNPVPLMHLARDADDNLVKEWLTFDKDWQPHVSDVQRRARNLAEMAANNVDKGTQVLISGEPVLIPYLKSELEHHGLRPVFKHWTGKDYIFVEI